MNSEEENWLNSRQNLNAGLSDLEADIKNEVQVIPRKLEEVKKEQAATHLPPKFTPAEKKSAIESWNNKPVTKKNGIEAVDTDKKKPVGKWKWKLCIFFAIIGFLLISSFFGIAGYFIIQDGTLRPMSILNATCTPIVNIPACPVAAACGDCKPIVNNNISVSGFSEICKGYCLNKGCNSTLF